MIVSSAHSFASGASSLKRAAAPTPTGFTRASRYSSMKCDVMVGRAARSETKSKISSRGAEMMAETVTSRMRARSYRPDVASRTARGG